MNDRTLTHRRDGGFRLTVEEGEPFRLEPEGDGLAVRDPERCRGWTIAPAGEGNGLVLLDAEQVEFGTTSRGPAPDSGMIAPSLLARDGRLFRIRRGGPHEAGYRLCGWETPGAYLLARPEEDHWRITFEPASAAVPDLDAIVLLFSAEILVATESE